MNRNILIGLTTLVLGTAAAQAGNSIGHAKAYDRSDRDMARVLHVEPLIERVRYTVPVQQCRDEQRVSDGGGKTSAIVGAALGEPRQHCEVHQQTRWEERVVAYRVTYVYNGRRDVTRLDRAPGRYFRLADARRWG